MRSDLVSSRRSIFALQLSLVQLIASAQGTALTALTGALGALMCQVSLSCYIISMINCNCCRAQTLIEIVQLLVATRIVSLEVEVQRERTGIM